MEMEVAAVTTLTAAPTLPSGYEWARLYRGTVIHIRLVDGDVADCGAGPREPDRWGMWVTGDEVATPKARRCGDCMDRFPDVFNVPGMGGG